MARGMLAGIVTGIVVAGVGFGAAILTLGPVEMRPGATVPAAMPEVPAAEEPQAAPQPEPEPAADEAPAPEPDEAAPAAATPAGSEPAPEPAAEAPQPAQPEPAAEVPQPAQPDLDEPAVAPPPLADPPVDSAAAPEPLPEIVVEAAPGAAPAAPPASEPAPAPEPDTPRPPETVVTGRLPAIGAEPEAAPAPARAPALTRNAIAFEAGADQPRLAILLLDTGARDELGDLGKLPFPISVVVDASSPDAESAIAFYRALGAEVVLLIPLPEGATPSDIDVSVEAYAPLMEEAVAVMVEEALGFQTLGDGAVQLATNLTETGHGLVTFPAGLNTGHKAATKEGVSAGLVFSDLDGKGQGGTVIRRFLDNAAFRARGEAGVIVLARTQPDTIQALLEWSLGNRAQSVALAPISAALAVPQN